MTLHQVNNPTLNYMSQTITQQTPFNKPYLTGNEQEYIADVLKREKLSGNGYYTEACHNFFKEKFNFKECFLTTSCTDALEMAGILLDIQPGDEVIVPSYTFVSSANAFVLRGAKIVFADSRDDHPNMDKHRIEELITEKTKAIVVVHYGGVAFDMDMVMSIAEQYGLYVVEDAAQATDAYYKGRPLGSIGHLGALSFHETKNISCGEGGLLIVNDERFVERAEIIREKGTDRTKFLRGEVNKYGWVDVGSSFLPSELNAAFLYAQLRSFDEIQDKRKAVWHYYNEQLAILASNHHFKLPVIPKYATVNGHVFYIVLPNEEAQIDLRTFLKNEGVSAVFHYNPLHRSDYYKDKHDGRVLANSDKFDQCLLRLPLYTGMTREEQDHVISAIYRYYNC